MELVRFGEKNADLGISMDTSLIEVMDKMYDRILDLSISWVIWVPEFNELTGDCIAAVVGVDLLNAL